MKKKKIVEEDKKKITLVIKELDEKKKQALRTAWDQVEDKIQQSLNCVIVVHLRSTKTLDRFSRSCCQAQPPSWSRHRVKMFWMGSRLRWDFFASGKNYLAAAGCFWGQVERLTERTVRRTTFFGKSKNLISCQINMDRLINTNQH